MKLTAGSLFSGIGGLDLAAAMAGFDIRFHVEFDDWRRKVLAKHAPKYWPNAVAYKDIREVAAQDLPRVDVLFGGFPCQDVSVAGKRAGLGEGTRSGLWYHFRRLIGDLCPRAVVVENVKGLLSMGGDRVTADLAQLGYVGRWGIISASDASAPHLRERVFVVAYAQQNRQSSAESRPGQSADSEERRYPLCQPQNHQQRHHHPDQTQPGGHVHRAAEALADTNQAGCSCHPNQQEGEGTLQCGRHPDRRAARVGCACANESRMGRDVDGIPARLDGFVGFPAYQNQPQHSFEPSRVIPPRTTTNRTARVEALGDAVVPWQAYPVFYYLHKVLQDANP